MKTLRLLIATPILASILTALGCSPEPPTISLRYSRDAEYSIPAGIKVLAIAPFYGESEGDARWAGIASGKLASALDEAGRHQRRYDMVDRKRLKEIMDEHDMKIVSGKAAAAQLGKLVGADALVYGTVNVATEKRATQHLVGGAYHADLFAMVSITFNMVNVNETTTVTSVSIKREYDSSKAPGDDMGKKLRKMAIGADALPAEVALDNLATECVQRFVAKIAPHEVTVTVALEKGEQEEQVDAGNKLAKSGEHAAAMEYYERAIAEDAEDYGAIFNLGVMYEAQRKFSEAARMYKKAFDLGKQQKFSDAWSRVRTEGNAG